jgi:hypothetical protein
MSHHEKLLGRAAYYRQKAIDSKSDRQATDMLELASLFMQMAYDVRALETARWPSSPASSPQPTRSVATNRLAVLALWQRAKALVENKAFRCKDRIHRFVLAMASGRT